ncbi:hypothetical protein A2961_02835 [Candidatus Woesebacteria bacterium RIFCSPLOWO2_01_FULL_39_21]|uniref:Uncharacterized protein n=1 Tax=Candidatus Woesebacteria bacterium RIFCSPLOWO2_01_FULL_39_21 TaxID=1802519 RepID=A0A1F8BF35_9BACT|nr:MAG: hypothetical protein A2691_04670 [Candidatus Woesebacteria bacterium RIFCSPHIGHO2_01_FULL_39_23]OGM61975.1 MAG: hypothetical protein A2961_02835 [Candidatus Woesebacteria bacterium RIFCSPLOWO2_01_FULL_39_21]
MRTKKFELILPNVSVYAMFRYTSVFYQIKICGGILAKRCNQRIANTVLGEGERPTGAKVQRPLELKKPALP